MRGAQPTACVKVVRVAVMTAAAVGVAPADACGAVGVTPERLADPATRVPHELAVRAWTLIPRMTGIDDFGLRAAELVVRAPFDVVDHALRTCSTLRGAVELLMRYQRLLHDGNDVRLEATAQDAVVLSQRLVNGTRMPAHLADFITAQWVLRSAELVGGPVAVLRAALMRPIPDEVAAHRAVFPCPIAFGESCNAIWFDPRVLDQPVASADASLAPVLQRHADDLLASLPPAAGITSRLREMFAASLSRGAPELPDAARVLGMSARSLQRQLDAEGTSFKAALDDVRRDLALAHLRDGGRTISEVAFLVGFAEVSAFSRAFRRWTGRSAKAWLGSAAGDTRRDRSRPAVR